MSAHVEMKMKRVKKRDKLQGLLTILILLIAFSQV